MAPEKVKVGKKMETPRSARNAKNNSYRPKIKNPPSIKTKKTTKKGLSVSSQSKNRVKSSSGTEMSNVDMSMKNSKGEPSASGRYRVE